MKEEGNEREQIKEGGGMRISVRMAIQRERERERERERGECGVVYVEYVLQG